MIKFEKLFDSISTAIEVSAEKGDVIKVASDSMISMTDTFDVKITSGCMNKFFSKFFAGEPIVLVDYHALSDGKLVLSQRFLGDIEFLNMDGNSNYALSKRAFLASTENINLEVKKEGREGITEGDGIFVVEASGKGTIAICATGKIIKKQLKEGESLIIDQNHVVLKESNIKHSIRKFGDEKISIESGEGNIMKFFGPGLVWYQTKNPSYFINNSIN
ncbi:AIM24 family protein [Clostridium sardiniense]|uniref:AIM24 family protein n=1 Tax=Clostridium sardiniense TaxID=29369 RepID=UPI003D34F115